MRDHAFVHKPDPVHTSLRNLKLDMRDHGRALGKLRSSLQTPTHPIYPTDPDDPVETQIAWRGEKREPWYYRNGAWHPFGGAGEWAAVQFSNQTVPGDNAYADYVFDPAATPDGAYFFSSPFDGDIFTIDYEGDHKIYIHAEGVYEFTYTWFFVGDGADITDSASSWTLPEQQNLVDAIHVTNPAGSIDATGFALRIQSYREGNVSFPQPVFFNASQNSGVDKQLYGQMMIQRTSPTPHSFDTAEPFPTDIYPAGSQLP